MERKEAVEVYNGLINPKIREAFEFFAPELRESEDERIINAIIGILKNSNAIDINVSQERMFAWLEKQKEQKPVHTAKEMWKEMRLEVYAQASGNRHEPNYSDDSTKMFSLCDIDEIFEKIGNSTVGSRAAEWSEKDEEMLDAMVDIVSNSFYKPLCPREGMLAWLKFLPLRCPKSSDNWKPSEVCYGAKGDPDPAGVWIPTKEQMDALSYALQVMNTDLSPIAARTYQGLQEIHQNLKKLI